MVTSARDPRIVRAAQLLRRSDEHAFVIDDAELLGAAAEAGIEVEWMLRGDRIADDARRALSFAGQAPEVVAVCRKPPPPPAPLPPRSLVLARVADAGNVGSIVRTAAAFGIRRVSMTPGCADPWSRRALRAAKGATFAIEVAEQASLGGALLAAAVPRGGMHPRELPSEASVVLGSESDGLSAEERAACELAVTIPAPHFESLNVAAAAAILTYELARAA